MCRRLDRNARSDEEGSYTFRPTELVRGERGEVHSPRVQVDRDVAESLNRVGMNERVAVLALDRAGDRGDVLDRPDLVVHGHHGREDRLSLDGGPDGCWIDESRLGD